MSKRDRLDSILRLRRIREDEAKAEAVRAAKAEADAAAAIARRRAEAIIEEPKATYPLPPEMLLSLHLRGIRSQELIALAEEEHARTVERRRDAQRRLQQTAVDRRSLEKLAQRRTAEAVAARRAASDRVLDEIVTLQHAREAGS